VIRQVFAYGEYDCISQERDVSLILDCGANIGAASFYLLHRYPQAHVIAVEPDAGNFEICRRNLSPFADRITLVNAAVWPTSVPMRIQHGPYGGGEWALQVRPVGPGESQDVVATTIPELLGPDPERCADILKIDVEGAELELFRTEYDGWLRRTRNLAIELHGAACERAFFRAMASFRWRLQRSGELTICRDIHHNVDVMAPALPFE
jgi:FkbM family methyltransferase